MTLSEAKSLVVGSTVYHVSNKNADGTPQRWKVTSVKTWKTMPNRVKVGLKNGLRNYDSVSQDDLHLLMLHEPSPMRTFEKHKKNLKVDDNYVYSYGEPVAKIDDGKKEIVVDEFVSKTTSRHIGYVANQFGYSVVKTY